MASDRVRAVRTIFCATDFSPTAELAFAHAESLARRHRAALFVGHVVEPWPATIHPPLSIPDDTERILRAAATERLERLLASRALGGLVVESRVVAGGPGRESVELARSADADLIVVGTYGRSGLPHLLYGSTAEYIVRCSPIPVLTVHPRDPGPEAQFRTIIVPSDLSPGAAHAVDELARLFPAALSGEAGPVAGAGRGRARIVLVYVDELTRYFEPYGEETVPIQANLEARRGELAGLLEAEAGRLRSAGFEVVCRIVAGKPVHEVCELAKSEKASLIALGTHGDSTLLNLLMGRTAQRIVQHAPCPVLSVRAPDRAPTPP